MAKEKKEKPIKDRWLGARADAPLADEVDAYIEAADMSMGDLLRKSVKEYMLNHPIKQEQPDQMKVNKPGE